MLLTKETPHSIIDGGTKKIIYSAPAKDNSHIIVMDVKQEGYYISNNYVEFDIQEALKTTEHDMTANQAVVDLSSYKDWQVDRYASSNIIPYSTGASKAVIKVIDFRKHVSTVDAKISEEA